MEKYNVETTNETFCPLCGETITLISSNTPRCSVHGTLPFERDINGTVQKGTSVPKTAHKVGKGN